MTAQSVDYDPTDLVGAAMRDEERRRVHSLSVLEKRGDIVWLLSDNRGRRFLRDRLRAGGLHVGSDGVTSEHYEDHGFMCVREALRTEALRMLWPILRGVAAGHIPGHLLVELMTEVDER